MSEPIEVFGVFLDPDDRHASKHGLVVRSGVWSFKDAKPHFQSDRGRLLAFYYSDRDAKAGLSFFDAKRSWLYVHRYSFGFWSLLAIAVIAVPWEHFVNHDPWIEAPLWVGAWWFFFACIAYALIGLFWPKDP